jgi:hypothetical protein
MKTKEYSNNINKKEKRSYLTHIKKGGWYIVKWQHFRKEWENNNILVKKNNTNINNNNNNNIINTVEKRIQVFFKELNVKRNENKCE